MWLGIAILIALIIYSEQTRTEKTSPKDFYFSEKNRRSFAKENGYIFEKDRKEIDNSRASGELKDYIFWQFFAFPKEINYFLEEQNAKQILNNRNKKIEWSNNFLPHIDIKETKMQKSKPKTSCIGCIQDILIFIAIVAIVFGIIVFIVLSEGSN